MSARGTSLNKTHDKKHRDKQNTSHNRGAYVPLNCKPSGCPCNYYLVCLFVGHMADQLF